ncbi:GDA [Mytilus edulis]|uniref:SLC25A16 n=1 Tax=Mytilus edulis TaxID=6550 RepID=A0A8S3QT02_MYTED|nr:GDA [Mytilus edulis]
MKTDSRREMKEKGKNFVAGGVAGCCAKSLVAPLDRIKILLQAHNHHYKDLGVWSTLLKVKLKENISGLYKGNGIHMIRVFPYAGVQFMAYEKSKEIVKTYLHNYPQIGKFLAGSMAGISAVSITYPLDIIRARIAFQVTGDHLCIGLTETAGCIIKQDGIMGLYRGMTPTLLGMIPYAGTTFFSFETLKGCVLTISRLICYPFDVVKRKIQLSEMLQNLINIKFVGTESFSLCTKNTESVKDYIEECLSTTSGLYLCKPLFSQFMNS